MSLRSPEWLSASRKARSEARTNPFLNKFVLLLEKQITTSNQNAIEARMAAFTDLIAKADFVQIRQLHAALISKNTGIGELFTRELDRHLRKRITDQISSLITKFRSTRVIPPQGGQTRERGIDRRSTEVTPRDDEGPASRRGILPIEPKDRAPQDPDLPFDIRPYEPIIKISDVFHEVDPEIIPDVSDESLIDRLVALTGTSLTVFGSVFLTGTLTASATVFGITNAAEAAFWDGILDRMIKSFENEIQSKSEEYIRARGANRTDHAKKVGTKLFGVFGRLAEETAIYYLETQVKKGRQIFDLNRLAKNYPGFDLIGGKSPIQVKAYGIVRHMAIEYDKTTRLIRLMGDVDTKAAIGKYVSEFASFVVDEGLKNDRRTANAKRMLADRNRIIGFPRNFSSQRACENWIVKSAVLMIPDDQLVRTKAEIVTNLIAEHLNDKLLLPGIQNVPSTKMKEVLELIVDKRVRGLGITTHRIRWLIEFALNSKRIKASQLLHILSNSTKR